MKLSGVEFAAKVFLSTLPGSCIFPCASFVKRGPQLKWGRLKQSPKARKASHSQQTAGVLFRSQRVEFLFKEILRKISEKLT